MSVWLLWGEIAKPVHFKIDGLCEIGSLEMVLLYTINLINQNIYNLTLVTVFQKLRIFCLGFVSLFVVCSIFDWFVVLVSFLFGPVFLFYILVQMSFKLRFSAHFVRPV